MFGDSQLPQRLWSRCVVDELTGCWLWSGERNQCGYGRAWNGERKQVVHRWVYEVLVERVPAELDLDHLCRRRECCNPHHLEPVTRQENVRRAPKMGPPKQSHCKRGHKLTQENRRRDGGRDCCRLCDNLRARQYRERKKRKR